MWFLQYSSLTPNQGPSPSPVPDGRYGWEYDVPRFLGVPGLVWGVIGMAAVLGFLFWKYGVKRPGSGKGTGSGYVYEVDDK
jgi:hypothetical protein